MRPENYSELIDKRRALDVAQEAVQVASLALQEIIDRDSAVPESETRSDMQRFKELREKISLLADEPSEDDLSWGDGIIPPRIVTVNLKGIPSDFLVFFKLSSQTGNFSAIEAQWLLANGCESGDHSSDVKERISRDYSPGYGYRNNGPTYILSGNNIGSLEESYVAYAASNRMLEDD